MDERRARINDDLRGLIEGDVLFEALDRAPYSRDPGLFVVDPLGVVVPRTVDDVVQTARYAAEHGISLHPRGAATSVADGSTGPGLVIDFSRYFRRIVSIEADQVVAQSGVVLDDLNSRLAPLGRRVGPDPISSAVTTVGGMIGVNAVGPSSHRFGTTGDALIRLSAVFPNGELANLGGEFWPSYDDEDLDYKAVVVRKLGTLVRRNLDLLMRASQSSGAGYPLSRAATGVSIHLPRLLAGARGTLGLVTEATLRTVPVAAAQVALLFSFGRMVDAAEAVTLGLGESLSACELFDWRLIHLAREADVRFREWIKDAAEAVLVVSLEGDEPAEVAQRAAALVHRIGRRGRLVADPVLVNRRTDCDHMMKLRNVVEPWLMRLAGAARPIRLFEYLAVPPEHLAEIMQRLQALMREHDVTWVVDAHAGMARIHPRPFLDLSDTSDIAKLDSLAIGTFEVVHKLGGTVQLLGRGTSSTLQIVRRQFGDLLPVLREVKLAFDPLNILNPGVIIVEEGASPVREARASRNDAPPPGMTPTHDSIEKLVASDRDSRGLPGEPSAAQTPLILPVLRWEADTPLGVASRCNGCGSCRSLEPTLRMCPTFRALRAEAATPRAKSGLIQQILGGTIDPRLWGSEELKRHADLCVHCQLCARECPSGVDVSSLMMEAKAAYVENHGLSPSEWVMSRVDLWARFASSIPILMNLIQGSRSTRWLLERFVGLSRHRRLPRAHRWAFTSRAARLGLTRARPHEPGARVVYFVDTFANHYDQELAEAVVAVLRLAGVNVYVPARQKDSGMSALVAGDVEHARDLALANLRVLGNAVRDGYTVVCSEPTAALMLKQVYLKLTDDLDAALVAENTHDLGQYLTGLSARGDLPEPSAIRARVGYHQPCHLRSLDVGTPGLELIRQIPDLSVEFIDRGCSGMAGMFGLHRDHFRTSLRAGRGLLNRLRDEDIELGASECSACRLQMEQVSRKRALHPIKLLSLSYGLSPSLRRRWKKRQGPRD